MISTTASTGIKTASKIPNKNYNRIRKRVDFSLIFQSIPSLLVSLFGLALSGKLLDMEQQMNYARIYPIILLSNCILSFKGNTELLYAMYLSSSSQLKEHNIRNFLLFAFDNGCLVMAQSVIIGISVGLLGLAKNVISNVLTIDLIPRMMVVCILSSFISTIFIILLLVPSVLVAIDLGINPDNIVLPVIASIGDFIDIGFLILFIKHYEYASTITCCIPIMLVFITTPILIYFSVRSKNRIPIQSAGILLITYLLSTLSSYIIQIFSKKHLVLASSYPILCGLTGASSYVYLNKKVTSIQNMVPHNNSRCLNSVILASIIVAIAATMFMPLMGIYYKKSFSILFVTGFVAIVYFLLKIIDFMMELYDDKSEVAGVIGLPMIASIADLFSSIVVLLICFGIFGF